MLTVFDSETRGLWGDIFKVGYFDGREYLTFDNGKDFMNHILEVEKSLPQVIKKNKKHDKLIKDTLYLYAFNLEFDLGKLLAEMEKKELPCELEHLHLPDEPEYRFTPCELDYKESLIINSNFHRAKLLGLNIVFCDLMPIVKSSLKDAAKSFQLNFQKMELEEDDLEEYFNNVSPYDETLLKYLEIDVKATYELMHKVLDLSGLPEESFVRCPTVASLAMKIFKVNMPKDFEKIKNSELTKVEEEFVRRSYHGGRTEVFKNHGDNLFHYDVNSLYPAMMQNNEYPIGNAYTTYKLGDITRKGILITNEYMMETLSLYQDSGLMYIIDAEVTVPTESNIPVLPIKHNKKLLFPTGTFQGVWCSPEFEYALQCGTSINKIYSIMSWTDKARIFENFVNEHRTIKETSTGGKRTFAKYIQNSLYGKFGMSRERIVYEPHTAEKVEELEKKKIDYAEVCTYNGKTNLLKYEKYVYTDYIRPQFASFITAYARVELCKAMHYVESNGGEVYYCDTDAIVCSITLPQEIVHDNVYGKWKIERIAKHGIFILPKLYAEITDEGHEVLKSKGIVRKYMEDITFDDYRTFYDNMVKGVNLTLYTNTDGFYNRQKVITAMLGDGDFDRKISLSKTFRFEKATIHKRIFDFTKNTSTPIDINIII